MRTRKIIHVDMDAFYASVEQRDNPSLVGKPVVVGGDPSKRGVVAAASYEARACGIHSAMPMRTALSRCPKAVPIMGNFGKYRQVSAELHEILSDYTDLIEPIALDEAYLDVTNNKLEIPFGHRIAKMLKSDIHRRLQLKASAGLAPNKFLAKVASDLSKPDGLVVVMPNQVTEFLRDLAVNKIPGVGTVTARELTTMGIETIGQLATVSTAKIVERFGKRGTYLHERALGMDDDPVCLDRDPKQLSSENTFAADVYAPSEMRNTVRHLSAEVCARLQYHNLSGRTVTVKIRYPDFTTVTRSRTQFAPVSDGGFVADQAIQLLERSEAFQRGVRLLGVGVSEFADKRSRVDNQLDLFEGRPLNRK